MVIFICWLIELGVKCLEGTTERSDGNRVRSARNNAVRTMCLEGTTPQDMYLIHRHRRTAFQAEPFQLPPPRTASPVTVASLRTAFQAVNTLIILVQIPLIHFISIQTKFFRSPGGGRSGRPCGGSRAEQRIRCSFGRNRLRRVRSTPFRAALRGARDIGNCNSPA